MTVFAEPSPLWFSDSQKKKSNNQDDSDEDDDDDDEAGPSAQHAAVQPHAGYGAPMTQPGMPPVAGAPGIPPTAYQGKDVTNEVDSTFRFHCTTQHLSHFPRVGVQQPLVSGVSSIIKIKNSSPSHSFMEYRKVLSAEVESVRDINGETRLIPIYYQRL